jgi:membrane-bound ClpP family serine protease
VDPLILAFALYLLAVLLVVVDIFLPSGGILLAISGLLACASVYCGFQVSVDAGLTMLLVVLGTIPALGYAFIKAWPHTPIGRRVLLLPAKLPAQTDKETLSQFLGFVVDCRWPLAPTGPIQIGTQRFNAVSSDGGLIDAHQRVKVVDVKERLLVVSPTQDPLTSVGSQRSSATSQSQEHFTQPDLETPAEQLGLNDLDDLHLDK